MSTGKTCLLAALLVLGGGCSTSVSGGPGSGQNSGKEVTGGAATSGSSTGVVFAGTGGACGPASNLAASGSYGSSLIVSQLVSADLNGNGLLDLVAAIANPEGFTFAPIEVFFGLPDGGLSSPVQYPLELGDAVGIGDVNGDGHPDVVVSVPPYLLILLNDGSGALTQLPPAINIDDTYVTKISIADFNRDGLADLLIAEGEDYTASPEVQIVLLLGQDGGTFSKPIVIPGIAGGEVPYFLVSDLNKDGLPDIVANTSDGFDLAVLLNQGDGGFLTHLYPAPFELEVVSVPNESGAPDLAFASKISNGVQILKNSGDGRFSIGPTYPGPDGGYEGYTGAYLTVGDFNGDCIPDIATMACTDQACKPGSGEALFILYGNDAGGFASEILQPPGTAPDGDLVLMGLVAAPRALAISNSVASGGFAVYGDASDH